MQPSEDFLAERRRALEESFYQQHNAELLDKPRSLLTKDAIAFATGVTDPAIVDHLLQLGLTTEAVAALALVPLVQVAWADEELDDRERAAILQAANGSGISPGMHAFQLLDNWLQAAPDAKLYSAWRAYLSELKSKLSPSERATLGTNIIGRARAVADAAGGILGLENRISAKESLVLGELEQAFG